MAAVVRDRRGVIDQAIFHSDRGSTYPAKDFTALCVRLGIGQSIGRVGLFDRRHQRGLLLHPGTRGPLAATVRHQGPGPCGGDRLVLRLLQRPTPAQRSRVAAANRVREDRCCPAGGSLEEASTVRGDAHFTTSRTSQTGSPSMNSKPTPPTASRHDALRSRHADRRHDPDRRQHHPTGCECAVAAAVDWSTERGGRNSARGTHL